MTERCFMEESLRTPIAGEDDVVVADGGAVGFEIQFFREGRYPGRWIGVRMSIDRS